ncbi:MAG: hypothetical protein RBG13Loki_2165 [Promethearchaeota archaeon CR_4]|nr:MAG: hypothetical protein RBG13Loki_2165 [Candidatus Lokiarchaeota archaeon CR_4]
MASGSFAIKSIIVKNCNSSFTDFFKSGDRFTPTSGTLSTGGFSGLDSFSGIAGAGLSDVIFLHQIIELYLNYCVCIISFLVLEAFLHNMCANFGGENGRPQDPITAIFRNAFV